jgi:hypothetical protein
MKEALCKAFCGDLSVRSVPDGLAIKTGFRNRDGDAVSFFVVPVADGKFRVEDDGTTVPFLIESGVDFATETRSRALTELLHDYGATFDVDEMTIHSDAMPDSEIPRAALKFVALMLRMNDFLLLSQDHVASTFKEDAKSRIIAELAGRATIRENEPVAPSLAEVTPDMVLEVPKRPPVALFFGTTSQRINDAIFLQMAALHEAHFPLSVMVLLESEAVISMDLRRRATNRLAAVPVYRRDESAAVARVAREALGAMLH